MYYFRKFGVIIMLAVLITSITSEATLATPNNPDNDKLNAVSIHYAQSTCNGPSQSEFMQQFLNTNNTQAVTSRIIAFSTQSNDIRSANPFNYDLATYVKTKGQVNVPAYTATEDYTADEKNAIITQMKASYPKITILDEPTSAYNCHSYAWYSNTSSNPYWINDVGLFANDVHSTQIGTTANAIVGDIIVYLGTSNAILHSAIIVEINGDQVICNSKWGPSVLCKHEYNYIPPDYCADGSNFRYTVLRVTEHVWNYEESVNNQHTRTCTICDYELTEECVYSITYNNNGTHTATCTTCGHTSTESCTLQYINADTTRHLVKCTKCNYQRSEVCDLTYTTYDDGTHRCVCNRCGNDYTRACGYTSVHQEPSQHKRTCVYCEYSYIEDCYSVNTYCGDGNTEHIHKKVCETCDHVTEGTSETCTFAYKSNGDNTHVYACTQCRYVKSGPVACMFKSGKCLICGALKDSAILNAQEEDFSEN